MAVYFLWLLVFLSTDICIPPKLTTGSTTEPTVEPTMEPTTEPTTDSEPTHWWDILPWIDEFGLIAWIIILAALLFLILILIYCICSCCCCHNDDKKDQPQELKVRHNIKPNTNARKLYVGINTDDDEDRNNVKDDPIFNTQLRPWPTVDIIAGTEPNDSDEKTDAISSCSTNKMFPPIAPNQVETETKCEEAVQANDKKEQQIVINIHNHVVDAPLQKLPDDFPNLPNETGDTDTQLKGEGFEFDLNLWIMQTLKEVAPKHDDWTRYLENFMKHKITEDVLILLGKYKQEKSDEWKELLPEIGPRILFQRLWDEELLQQQQKIL